MCLKPDLFANLADLTGCMYISDLQPCRGAKYYPRYSNCPLSSFLHETGSMRCATSHISISGRIRRFILSQLSAPKRG